MGQLFDPILGSIWGAVGVFGHHFEVLEAPVEARTLWGQIVFMAGLGNDLTSILELIWVPKWTPNR